MAVIAVVNRKGGSGKSTIAAHIAAWCAHQGLSVILGDADPQQSSRAWLRRRSPGLPAIMPLTLDTRSVPRVPSGVDHVVLDTPGGLHGFELARIVMLADAIVMPVSPSMFDRESAAGCLDEIRKLPKVAAGRCPLAMLGMRVDERFQGGGQLQDWAESQALPFLGVLRESQQYVSTLEQGMTLFDLPAGQGSEDLAQWEPLLHWLRPMLQPLLAANDQVRGRNVVRLVRGARMRA